MALVEISRTPSGPEAATGSFETMHPRENGGVLFYGGAES